ncbi:hypothetical protein SAMN05446635_7592 [Burkholderia sp. OK233]|nr:hypothetical protein SAMN05446635_7592 [Burkholderia sp. OK233]
MPRLLSLASVVRAFRPRLSVSSTGHPSHILIRCRPDAPALQLPPAQPYELARFGTVNRPFELVRPIGEGFTWVRIFEKSNILNRQRA